MNRAIRITLILAVALGWTYFKAYNRRSGVGALPSQFASDASLADARARFTTRLTRKLTDGTPPPVPPADTFELVHYAARPGPMSAYLTPDPRDGQRHPAIVWITGGDCNTIGEAWGPVDPANDQSASAYRQAGIVMMFPSLRGGNDSPGQQEKFLGEVDDVIAAARHLATLPYVDPQRIYLGGHSTGGTLALLVAESTPTFRAVFSFGPVADLRAYGDGLGPWPFNENDRAEMAIRSPGYWLKGVTSPTFVLEGDGRGNADQVQQMQSTAGQLPALHWAVVPGKSHFSILAPANEIIAKKILADTGATPNIAITDADVAAIASH